MKQTAFLSYDVSWVTHERVLAD